MSSLLPTERFSSRAETYIKHRPSYPAEIINYLKSEAGLTPQSIIADVGSGTGFLSKIFLDNGNIVYGVEPNNPMRKTAEKYLCGYKNFISCTGRAEKSSLKDSSVDFITAGQAFHWFEPVATKKEFVRIVKPEGKVVLVWNLRDSENDPFQKEYESVLLEMCPEYLVINHKKIDSGVIKEFILPFQMVIKVFKNFQELNYDNFIGRLLSTSYCPDESSDSYPEFRYRVTELFNKYVVNEVIRFNYNTMVYWGRIK